MTTMEKATERNPVKDHLDRCIELYGDMAGTELDKPADRELHEQMRIDLMICVGIITAILARPKVQP